jgi:hypothetical protein
MISRHNEDLKFLNAILIALNEYIAAKGNDKKITSNRKGRRDDVKAIVGYVFACVGLSNPLDDMETSTHILPTLQAGSIRFDSIRAPFLYFRMIMGIDGVLSRLRTSVGHSSLRNKITPLLKQWEQHLLNRDLEFQGVILPVDPRFRWNTSDHVHQSVKVSFINRDRRERLVLSGSAMNLLNKCVSKEENPKGYKNNPWNYTETAKEYLARKELQFAKLIEIISSGQKDFMFLQEIDCLLSAELLTDVEDKIAFEILKKNFLDYLAKLGWAMTTNKTIAQGKPFITLYNANTLKPTGNVRMVLDGGGFECEFMHFLTREKVTLVNMHLRYDRNDYPELIAAYQEEQVKANRLTIMGGDCNHTPREIVRLINHSKTSTNLGGDDLGAITEEKCIDGFLISTDKQSAALIEELPSERFQRDPELGFMLRPFVPSEEYGKSSLHQCPPGQGWTPDAWKAFIDFGGWEGFKRRLKQKPEKPIKMAAGMRMFDQEEMQLIHSNEDAAEAAPAPIFVEV